MGFQVCHICRTTEAKWRCPNCGRLICPQCTVSGVCSQCYQTYQCPPQQVQQPQYPQVLGPTKAYTIARISGAVIGFLFGLIGVIIGAIVVSVTSNEETKQFGYASMLWGGISAAIAFTLVMAMAMKQPVP